LHSLCEREKKILELLTEDSAVSVSKLSKTLGVSTVTVRSQLNSLVEKGLIVRTHGAASIAFNPHIMARQNCRVQEKHAVAKAAAALVKDGNSIMIEAGTTTALIASYLRGKRDVQVVSNSTLVIPSSRMNPALHLTMVGGEFRPHTESMVGPIALRELEQFNVSLAFIGTDGFNIENGLTTHLVEGAEVVKRMAQQASRTVLVADSSKYGKTGFVRVLPLSSIDVLITDSGLDGSVVEELKAMGIETIIV
jgi:DeoR family galactitol utilization operon repressor